MKKLLCLAAVVMISVSAASAQNYNWALGVRAGGEMSGITGRFNLNAANALEAILAIPYDKGFTATVLYERNVPVIGAGWNFYYGAGGHIGEWDHDFAIGIDGIIGLEYKIPQAPIVLAVDYKPIFNIASDTDFKLIDFGFSVKVAF